MKKLFRKVISILLVAVMVLCAAPLAGFLGLELPEINLFGSKAEAATYNGTCGENLTWEFYESTGDLVISGTGEMTKNPWYNYRSSIYSIKISDGVTYIGHSAFANCTKLTNITIPDSVTSIGGFAFSGCNKLTSVTIPDSVTSIGERAFFDCDSLTSITIPDSVTSIGESAFIYCTSLVHVYYTGDVAGWCAIDFSDGNSNPVCYANNLYISGKTVKEIEIPDSVTSIGNYAFNGCENLESVTIGNGVTSIGDGAFCNCTWLTNITIPDSVISIGISAFNNCTRLTNITIPDSVTSIGNYAFEYCRSLASVTIPDSVTGIGNYAFCDCTNLKSITISDSVTTIGDHAFSDCNKLTSVTIPDSVTSIGDGAFLRCNSLTSITVDVNNSSYSSDEYGVLFNKDKTELIQYPAGNARESYKIPNSVTSVGDCAFYDFRSLTSITIPDSVTSIGNYAFYDCDSLTSITIPDSVISIGNSAFYYCTRLTNMTIPDSVTSIGVYAFTTTPIYKNADNWENQVLYIDNHLIAANPGFPSNYSVREGTKTIADQAFYGRADLSSVTIPDSVISIGDSAFKNCTSLESITIPDSVTSIGDFAFYNCYRISDVYYMGTEAEWSAISIGSNNGYLTDATIHYNHKHSYSSVITKEPTCTETGVRTFTCECKGSYTKPIPILEHDIIIDEDVEPTCTATGLTAGQHCSKCDDATVEQEVIPALNHKDTLVQVGAQAPTCTEIGWDDYEYCTACNYTTYEEKNALEHNIIIDEVVSPTCTSTGLTAGQHCSRCDDVTVKQETIPALNHKDTLVQVGAQAPTCTEIGWDAYEYCTACDYTTYAEKDALEHNIVIDEAVASTCTETGLTEGQHCSRCNDETIEQEVVPVLGHDIVIDEAVEATCTETGLAEGQHCSRCNDETIEQEIIPVKLHNHTAKYDSTKHWKECSCGSIIDEQNHSFVGGNTCSCGFKRVVNSSIKIKNNNGSKTINYGETLKLTAIVTDKPANAKIYWYIDGEKMSEGEVFDVKFENGTKIITVKLVDENGIVYQNANGDEIADDENVTVKGGFFQKIISFFKNLFGMNRTVVQSFFKVIY